MDNDTHKKAFGGLALQVMQYVNLLCLPSRASKRKVPSKELQIGAVELLPPTCPSTFWEKENKQMTDSVHTASGLYNKESTCVSRRYNYQRQKPETYKRHTDTHTYRSVNQILN